ncbi:MAG: Holliday junction branch migration DNA helicase RuvB [Abitibacteriaceae bacterium]|nr:Holliday junction branch migration DNA helicase RuvB [Abditibacteriaceae bacterium]
MKEINEAYEVLGDKEKREQYDQESQSQPKTSKERVVGAEATTGEADFDWGLRPKSLDEYVGQRETVERLHIAILASKQRGETLDHLLVHGPPGLGKTTLAYIIAEELDREISITSGPALERPGDVMPFLTNADDGDIIFIDEIHRLPRVVEEFLYSAMEDYMVNFTLDKGMYSKPLPFRLKKFTIIGATTRPAMLTRPLRDRFGIQQHLDFYDESDLVKIARRSSRILHTKIETAGAHELARRARGTPRIVNRLLRRVRDYAQVRADGVISKEVAEAALKLEGIDELGLDRLDHGVLNVIKDIYNGGPVGIEALAATLNEEVDTLVDVVEPYLLKIGFLARTPSGRRITRRAYEHLGEPPPPGAITIQPSLLDEAFDANESLRQKAKAQRKGEIGAEKNEEK